MSRIEEQPESVGASNARECVHVARSPPQVDAHDSGGSLGYERFDSRRIDVVRRGVDIAEHGGDALPPQRVSRRDECQRGHDDFTRKAERARREFESDRRVARGQTVFHAEQGTDSFFDFPHARSVIGEPPSIQDLIHTLQEKLAVSGVRKADVARLTEEGWPSPSGKIAESTFLPQSKAAWASVDGYLEDKQGR